MQSGSQPPPDDIALLISLSIGFLIAGIIYIIPSIAAFRRSYPNRWIILVINLAFGGTVIGWGITLVWAMRAAHRVGSTSSGGESGLNLFVNDVKKVQVAEPPPLPQASVTRELERLHNLLTRGVIPQVEFDDLKTRLLGRSPAP